MADPTTLTAVIGCACAAAGASAAWFAAAREKNRDDKDEAEKSAANSVASWATLAAAHDREITRLHQEMDRLRDDSEQHLRRLRDEYEQHLQAARLRITELEAQVETLRQLLRRDQGQP